MNFETVLGLTRATHRTLRDEGVRSLAHQTQGWMRSRAAMREAWRNTALPLDEPVERVPGLQGACDIAAGTDVAEALDRMQLVGRLHVDPDTWRAWGRSGRESVAREAARLGIELVLGAQT